MSISTVSSGAAALQTLRSNFQDQKNYLDQLQQAVSSGNTQGAQQAYDSLSKLIQNNANAKGGQPFGGNTTLQKDFSALGDALKTGDKNQIQAAYAQFAQDLQAARAAHHHHHNGGTAATNNSSSSSTQSADSDGDNDGSTTSVNLTA
jgi:hypothetical protein